MLQSKVYNFIVKNRYVLQINHAMLNYLLVIENNSL
jgi:hypothetical protein